MNARIFNFNGVLEAQLANGSSIQGDTDETITKFRKRVKGYIEDVELEDAVIGKTVTLTQIQKLSTEILTMEVKSAKGVYFDMIQHVLQSPANGEAEPEVATVDPAIAEAAAAAKAEVEAQKAAVRAEKAAAAEKLKAEKLEAKEAKAAARLAAKEAKLAEKEAKAEERKKIAAEKLAAKEAKAAARAEAIANRPTVEQVLQEAVGLQSLKNSVVTFIPFGSDNDEQITGVVNGIVTDKRVPMNLIRIHVSEGDRKIYHLRPTNPTLAVDNEATAKLVQEIADAAQAIADEKQAKIDAKAAAKAEKLAAKEAKAAAEKEAADAKAAVTKEENTSPVVAPKTVYEAPAEDEDETEELF